MLGNCIENVRKSVPLVHNITNYETVNDVANVLLACGGSPIMSDEPEDVKEINIYLQGLNHQHWYFEQKKRLKECLQPERSANELGHVTLLDPVGARCKCICGRMTCRRTDWRKSDSMLYAEISQK